MCFGDEGKNWEMEGYVNIHYIQHRYDLFVCVYLHVGVFVCRGAEF